LQEQEFERLGGNRTLRVDVRVVARPMGISLNSSSERKFRSDLYYRLNVFPILFRRSANAVKTCAGWCAISFRLSAVARTKLSNTSPRCHGRAGQLFLAG